MAKNLDPVTGLTPLQQAFVSAFRLTHSGSKSVRMSCPKATGWTTARIAERAKGFMAVSAVKAAIARDAGEDGRAAGLDNQGILRQYRERLDTNITDLADWDGRLLTFKPFDQLTRAQANAIESVKQRVDRDGTVTFELQMYNRDALLVDAAKRLWPVKGQREEGETPPGQTNIFFGLPYDVLVSLKQLALSGRIEQVLELVAKEVQ